jgi:hypothetical protein
MENTQTPEEQRQDILRKCNEVIGQKDSVIAGVLSYFPEQAQQFIKTQEHGSKVSGGVIGLWFVVKHEEKGLGLGINQWFKQGGYEHLGIHGFTGEPIIERIRAINQLRGKETNPEYLVSDETIKKLLEASVMTEDAMDIWEAMTAKVLEVMGVTETELSSLRNYTNAKEEVHILQQQAAKLEKAIYLLQQEAATLGKKAKELGRQAREMLIGQ